MFRCSDCKHGFVNPQPSWEELAPYYSEDYAPYDPAHAAEASDAEAMAEARRTGRFRHVAIGPDQRILDVGCGGGYFLRIASALGARAEGVEPSEIGARRALESGLTIFQGTLEDYADRHGDRRFDLITANHVLEHVPDPIATLSVMREILAAGGLIWISVPNADCVSSRRLCHRWHSASPPIHLMHFNRGSLAEVGSRAGLVARSLRTDSLPRGVAASVRSYLRHNFLIPQRLTGRVRLIDTMLAPRLARRWDRLGDGEALIAEFVRAKNPANIDSVSSNSDPDSATASTGSVALPSEPISGSNSLDNR